MKEIERKFLVNKDKVKEVLRELEPEARFHISQGYLCDTGDRSIRIRALESDNETEYTMTVKANRSGCTRDEIEFHIPQATFSELFDICRENILFKSRNVLQYGGFKWEVDIFHGPHQGLIVAEIELPDEQTSFDLPPWVTREVTNDGEYSNAALAATRHTPSLE